MDKTKSHIANAFEADTYIPKKPNLFIKGAHLRDFAMKVAADVPNGEYRAECTVHVTDGYARITSNIEIDTSETPGGTWGKVE